MTNSIRRLLLDEGGQVTIEWTVLAVGLGTLAVVIVLAVGKEIIRIIDNMLMDLSGQPVDWSSLGP